MTNPDPNTAPYYELPLLGFDTETDGVNPLENHVITCNITYDFIDGRPNESNDWILKPQGEIPEGASDVHGITTEYAQEHGREPSEALYYIHEHLWAWESSGCPLVAFNAAYDCTILDAEWRRHGIQSKVKFDRVIDPFVIDKKAFPYRKGKRTLSRLAEVYMLTLDNAHSADADVLATLQLARKLPKAVKGLDLSLPLDSLHMQQVLWKAEQSKSLQDYFRSKEPDKEKKKLIVVNGDWPVQFEKTDEEEETN